MARLITISVCLATFALVTGQFRVPSLGGVIRGIGQEAQNDLVDLKEIPEDGLGAFVSTACPNVRSMFGMSYDRMARKNIDMSELRLDYINANVSVAFNLETAGYNIPLMPGFAADQKVYLYLHGFTDDPTQRGFQTISNALFTLGNANVLALDSSSMIAWLYLRSSAYVRLIGERLGRVLETLVSQGVSPTNIHIVGHSLGAQIAAFAGKQLLNSTGLKVGRITGLDPAGPCFSNIDPDLRLENSDADFVDVIHTDAGIFGITTPIGHVDYYPNDGQRQPGCVMQSCSHSRAWRLYAESVVNATAFPAVQCDSWYAFRHGRCSTDNISYMGHPSVPGTTGVYYLQTSGESPFGLGTDGLNFNSNGGIVRKGTDGVSDVIRGLLRPQS